MKKYYYLYRITNKLNDKIYIGVHSTNKLRDRYMGSSKPLKNDIKKYGVDNFEKVILEFFSNKEDMMIREREVVNSDFIKKNTYNIVLGGGFNCSGTVNVIDKNGKITKVHVSNEKYLNGELAHTKKIRVKNKKGETLKVYANDNRIISGELKPYSEQDKKTDKNNRKNKRRYKKKASDEVIKAKDKNGKTYIVKRNDERVINGTLKFYAVLYPNKPRNKIDKNEVKELRKTLKIKELAERYNVSIRTINRILK